MFVEWLYRSLVLLVIACPCALVISTPVTLLSGLTNAARHGVLIKGGRYLEALGKLRAIAFDKTGTLHKRRSPCYGYHTAEFAFTGIHSPDHCGHRERSQRHHLANAVVNKASEARMQLHNIAIEDFISMTGSGIGAQVDGVRYVVGNHALVEEKKICSPAVETILQRLEKEGKTVIVLCSEQEPLGIIAIADEIRRESSGVVRALREQGMEKIVMLTGDNNETARAIAGASASMNVTRNFCRTKKQNAFSC